VSVERPSEGGDGHGTGFGADALAGIAVLVSVALAGALLPLIARHDRHFHTDLGGVGDVVVRQGAGLFLFGGLVISLPSLAAAVRVRRYRWLLVAAGVVALLVGAVCELVVSLAPEPWFTF
jgi:hypothetical protein